MSGINGHLAIWNSTSQIIDGGATLSSTNFPALTGDVTSAGATLTTTVAKIDGTTVPTNSAADQTLVTTASATGAWTSIPNCADSSGNHLNYDTTAHAFSCGTSSSGSVNWAVPGTIGSTTPNTGAFTTLSASSTSTLTGNVGVGGASVAGTGLNIASITQSGTNAYGLAVNAPGGATNNYAATFSGGNVGIGTTSPGAALEINGQIKITGGTPGASKVLTSDAAGLATWQAASAAMTYPGSGVAVSTGSAWTTSLSATELTGLAGLSTTGLVKRTGAGTYTTDSTAYAPLASPTFTGTVTTPALNLSGQTASTVPYLDASKNLVSSTVTPTTLGFLDATSSIQTQLNSKVSSSGTVSGINGHLATWNGTSQIIDGGATLSATNFPALAGDVTSAGATLTTTVAKINGTTVPTNSAADQALVTTAAATGAWTSIPNCADSSGNHLNYDTTAHTFSCGTSSSVSVNWAVPGTIGSTTPNTGAFTTLSASGNVGIGTTSPSGTLDVEGGISTSGSGANIVLTAQNGKASGVTNGGQIILTPGTANSTGNAGYVSVQGNGNEPALQVYSPYYSTAGIAVSNGSS